LHGEWEDGLPSEATGNSSHATLLCEVADAEDSVLPGENHVRLH
jgi:hypothetical protein